MRHVPRLTGLDHLTDHIMTFNTPQTYSAIILDIRTKRSNRGPHQWCSGPRMKTQVCIYYATILWVWYEACTTSDRGGSPHTSWHDLQLNPIHTQLLTCILEPRTKSLNHVSRQWCSDPRMIMQVLHAIPPLYECYVRHGPCLTGVGHPTDHDMTTNFTPRHAHMLPWFSEPRP